MSRIFSFDEIPESRTSTLTPPSETRVWLAIGEPDDAVAKAYAYAATPVLISTPLGILYRQDVRGEPNGWGQHKFTVPYGQRNRTEGEWSWDYDTTGATTTIKCAKEHIASYPPDEANPNPHKGAIGVTKDLDVEGAEITIPSLKFDITYNHPLGEITFPYAKALASITGRTNSTPFLTFEPGELLFLGSTGSDGTNSPATAKYSFAASSNVTDLTFGEITSIVKQGWHVAWVEFKKDVAAGQATAPPKRVHVERVYDGFDFASFFGWGV